MLEQRPLETGARAAKPTRKSPLQRNLLTEHYKLAILLAYKKPDSVYKAEITIKRGP